MIRLFYLDRKEDASGISGTGKVAEGVEFSNGVCVVQWLTHTSSTNIYQNMKQVESIHGHGGSTKIVIVREFDDEMKPVRRRRKKES